MRKTPETPHLDVTVGMAWVLMCIGTMLGLVVGVAVGLNLR